MGPVSRETGPSSYGTTARGTSMAVAACLLHPGLSFYSALLQGRGPQSRGQGNHGDHSPDAPLGTALERLPWMRGRIVIRVKGCKHNVQRGTVQHADNS